jgi:hypothetical protein
MSNMLSRQVPSWREYEKQLAKEMRDLKAGRKRLFRRKQDVTAEQIVAKSWELHCLRQLIAMGEGRKLTRRYLG